MKIAYSVLTILQSICENKSSRTEVNQLIELSQSYAYTYLKYRYKNLSKVLMAEDLTLQELAIDAIAPLFERNETGIFIKITKAFSDWEPRIDSEEKAVFFLNRIVAKSVEKYASELLRQSDPFFSKILDSVNYIIEKQGYKKKQILGTTYIVEDENLIKVGSLPDSKYINELPIELFSNNSKILVEIFNYLKSNTAKTYAIPLNVLVMKIKQFKSAGFNLADSVANGNEIEIESIISKALDVTISKMQESYLKKNKIDENEAKGIKKAIDSIVYDMRDGGINPGLHKYFLEQFSGLSFEDYENRYQNIFEYLFKVLKKEIAEQLK
jgi:hypothetical protein